MLTAADTAFAIATVRARESELPEAERLFEDPYAKIFVAAVIFVWEGVIAYIDASAIDRSA
jgi:O-methyltransferase involved in polyketide biosynthesis